MSESTLLHDDAFDPGGFSYQDHINAMTYDCNRQQQQQHHHQGNYAMQGLNMVDSNTYSLGPLPPTLDLYSSDFNTFQTDLMNASGTYYSNPDLIPPTSYDHGNDGPSSSGLNVGQYFSMDHMMLAHQQQSQSYSNGGVDYTDVNNLEPSLMPDQMNGMQGSTNQQHHQSLQLPHQLQPSITNQQPRHLHHNQMAAYVTANYYGNSYHSSPTGSSHTSSGTDISDEGDEMFLVPHKRSPPNELEYGNVKGKRQGKKRKPRKDPNEPQKPVSAYALFFRDTQAAIKGQNPNASFGEISKIVASMWDNLETDAKTLYKQKTESAKKEYLKQLAAYRANLLSKGNRSCMTMDPFAELAAQQRKSSMQPSPDSTTSTGLESQKDPCTGIGTKTLASLIAEPAPQHVLTATTTLTVPQSYGSNRTKGDYSDNDSANTLSIRTTNFLQKQTIDEQAQWSRDYSNDDCVAKNCRDMYTSWVPTVQPQQQAGTFAPV